MQATILEGLFSRFLSLDFKALGIMPYVDGFDVEDDAPEAYKAIDDSDIAYKLTDKIGDYAYAKERAGFIGGVRIGMYLAWEIFGTKTPDDRD